jgi:hypothetical protein
MTADSILRAELRTGNDLVISSGAELGTDSIFVITTWRAAIDTEVHVRLAFAGLLVELPARVAELRAAPAGVRVVFDAEARARIAAVCERLRRTDRGINSPRHRHGQR